MKLFDDLSSLATFISNVEPFVSKTLHFVIGEKFCFDYAILQGIFVVKFFELQNLQTLNFQMCEMSKSITIRNFGFRNVFLQQLATMQEYLLT